MRGYAALSRLLTLAAHAYSAHAPLQHVILTIRFLHQSACSLPLERLALLNTHRDDITLNPVVVYSAVRAHLTC